MHWGKSLFAFVFCIKIDGYTFNTNDELMKPFKRSFNMIKFQFLFVVEQKYVGKS